MMAARWFNMGTSLFGALAPGVAVRLHPREVHLVENTQETAELAVLGIFTPAGSPSAAYLEPDVAGSYVIAGGPG